MSTLDLALQGRTAIITGGSGGIGRGCARAFARAGANLVLASVPPEDLPPAIAEMEALGAQALGISVDVSDPEQVQTMVEQALARFGHIDILVNTAGGSYSRNSYTPQFERNTLLNVSPADFMGAFEVNVKGTFLCARAVVPSMRAHGKGVIVNIGSSAGRNRPAGPEMAAYAAAKAAVHSLTINMAHQWAPEIRVNCIAPGVIDTPRPGDTTDRSGATRGIAVGRLGSADDIGQTALFLVSDAAAFVNGAILDVTGGS